MVVLTCSSVGFGREVTFPVVRGLSAEPKTLTRKPEEHVRDKVELIGDNA
jgi:hypothetical protein